MTFLSWLSSTELWPAQGQAHEQLFQDSYPSHQLPMHGPQVSTADRKENNENLLSKRQDKNKSGIIAFLLPVLLVNVISICKTGLFEIGLQISHS